jgi:hypothetical protein
MQLFALCVVFSFVAEASDLNQFTIEADAFLQRYVKNGEVSYGAIRHNLSEIENLYQKIGKVQIQGTAKNVQKAFYINAYNIIVVYWVARHFPLKSPLDHAGFFDQVKHRVAGEDVTLNTLEQEKLLKRFQDARVHFALACAAKSCPPLANFAYTDQHVEQQLLSRTRLAVNNRSWLRVNAARKSVQFSMIFDWYKGDFDSGGNSVIDWVNPYRDEKIPAGYKVDYYPYDWRLNGH